MTEAADAALSSVLREEWPRLIGAALRIVGDLQTAEDVVQETLLTALDRWPLQGVPARPGAWLMTACRNRARNVIRDTRRGRQRISSASYAANNQEPADARPGVIADDRLRLITLCCHPLLPVDGQVALTLRMVGGLATDEIARGFHLPAATIAQRIVRAKRALKAHRADFTSHDLDISERLPAVLDVIYLVFNEGYLAAAGETLTRGDLAYEAYRLVCLLTDLTAAESEVWALRALLSFQLSRWTTRSDGRRPLARSCPCGRTARTAPAASRARSLPRHRADFRRDGLVSHRRALRRADHTPGHAGRGPEPGCRRRHARRARGRDCRA